MIKIKYKYEKDGISVEVEAEYENYEAINSENSKLKNRLVFDYNDIKSKMINEEIKIKQNKNPITRPATTRKISNYTSNQPVLPGFAHNGPNAHLTVKQFEWLVDLGYYPNDMRFEDCPLTYKEAYELLKVENGN